MNGPGVLAKTGLLCILQNLLQHPLLGKAFPEYFFAPCPQLAHKGLSPHRKRSSLLMGTHLAVSSSPVQHCAHLLVDRSAGPRPGLVPTPQPAARLCRPTPAHRGRHPRRAATGSRARSCRTPPGSSPSPVSACPCPWPAHSASPCHSPGRTRSGSAGEGEGGSASPYRHYPGAGQGDNLPEEAEQDGSLQAKQDGGTPTQPAWEMVPPCCPAALAPPKHLLTRGLASMFSRSSHSSLSV